MQFEISWLGVIVAGLAAMVPGFIIYLPGVLGNVWKKQLGETPKSFYSPVKAIMLAFAASLSTALIINVVFTSSLILSPGNLIEGFMYGALLSIFAISASALSVFFDGQSWTWLGIAVLNHVLSYAVTGAVLAIFL